MENEEMPIHRIFNVKFYVDTNKNQLINKKDPSKTISLTDMDYRGDYYIMSTSDYNIRTMLGKNCGHFIDIPQLIKLDPVGMARKFGKSLKELEGESDFTLTVDQNALARRLSGQSVEILIYNHPFYVDVEAQRLVPKGKPDTPDLFLDEIEDLGDGYCTAYNPRTLQAVPVNYYKISKYPKTLVLVQFPTLEVLDPVGYHMDFCRVSLDELKTDPEAFMDLQEHLMKNPRLEPLPAKIVPWEEIGIHETIAENKARRAKEQQEMKAKQPQEKVSKRKKGNHL